MTDQQRYIQYLASLSIRYPRVAGAALSFNDWLSAVSA